MDWLMDSDYTLITFEGSGYDKNDFDSQRGFEPVIHKNSEPLYH